MQNQTYFWIFTAFAKQLKVTYDYGIELKSMPGKYITPIPLKQKQKDRNYTYPNGVQKL